MKNISYTYILILSLHLCGCKKLVEIDLPQNRLTTESAFSTNESACAAMAGLYTNMIRHRSQQTGFSYEIAFYTGLYGDELEGNVFSSGGPLWTVYTNGLLAASSPTNSFWVSSYNYIYQANSIIAGLQGSKGVSQPVKDQLAGEALFIRAFWHFYLINLYGDVPLVTSTDYSTNGRMSRTSMNNVYDQIVVDLIKAKSLLTNKYVGANSINEVTERLRVNISVASALLARVYLFREEWQLAELESSSILSSSNYNLESIAGVFKRNSKEAIWQFDLPTPNIAYNTWEANNFTIAAKPIETTTKSTTISNQLLSKLVAADLRRSNWIGTFTDISVIPNVKYLYPAKYKSLSSTVDESSAVFRLAEIYLIRAEALVKQNKLAEAINDLDLIRNRAGIGLLKKNNPSIGKDALTDSIMVERQRELFCEYGHRWFDLKRTGRVNEVMDVITSEKGGSWSSSWAVWPIPQVDINNNNKLVQNKDYN